MFPVNRTKVSLHPSSIASAETSSRRRISTVIGRLASQKMKAEKEARGNGIQERDQVIRLLLALARYEVTGVIKDNRLVDERSDHREVKFFIESRYGNLPRSECIWADAEHGKSGSATVDRAASAIQPFAMSLQIGPGLRCRIADDRRFFPQGPLRHEHPARWLLAASVSDLRTFPHGIEIIRFQLDNFPQSIPEPIAFLPQFHDFTQSCLTPERHR